MCDKHHKFALRSNISQNETAEVQLFDIRFGIFDNHHFFLIKLRHRFVIFT